jgi:methionyl-tRNA formyltransferase
VALFGLDCSFSIIVLRGLVEHGFPVAGVYLPGPRSHAGVIPLPARDSTLPLHDEHGRPPGMRATAGSLDVPLFTAGNLRDLETQAAILVRGVDVACCACFSELLPKALYSRFPLGGINLHPTLLPDKRGPDPAFWTFKQGDGRAGMTIHRLNPRFDAGAILAQRPCQLLDGATEAEWERLMGDLGVELLVDLLPRLASGTAQEHAQDDSQATYAPWPSRGDFNIDRDRPARAAFNFARGLEARGYPFIVELDGEPYRVAEAVGYADDATSARPGEDVVAVPCNPGVLFARLAPLRAVRV